MTRFPINQARNNPKRNSDTNTERFLNIAAFAFETAEASGILERM